MSYASFSTSDVFVFLHTDHYLECCGCVIQPVRWLPDSSAVGGHLEAVEPLVVTTFTTTDDLLAHLERHRRAGHAVRDDTIAALRRDQGPNDEWMSRPQTPE